jgi:hypothetical protein
VKRIAGILTLLISLNLISVESAFSDFSLQNCLSIRNIATTVDGTKISVRADAYQTCSEFTSPNFDGYSPRYSISNLGLFCSGPALRSGRQTFLPVSLGSISCSGTSEKYGTTSSTISASLGYVNYSVNEVSVRFSHEEIVRVSKRADCIELRSPSSSQSSTLITLKFDVYATCSSGQLGSSLGRNPLYQMTQEESLFNLSSCSGPSVSPLIGSGWLGTATCSLRVGSNTLPSSRTGATSTIIEVKFVWDFSSKTISVPHSAIPGRTNSGGGGSTGGGIVAPSCLSAPSIPNLSYTNLTDGIQFTATAQTSGEKATNLSYTYSYLDEAKGIWGEWNEWITVSSMATISYKAPSGNGKIAVAFAVYASNSCGKSAQVRESISKTGLNLPEVPASPDAVQEAIDAANAATDAANAAAVTSSMNLVAAQSSLDIVAALSLQVDEIISSLKVQIAALSALILKIQAKMNR